MVAEPRVSASLSPCSDSDAYLGRPRDAMTGVTVEVARTLEHVEALRDAWSRAGITVLDSHIDYFKTVVRTSGFTMRPHVVRIRRPGVPDLWGIARVDRVPVPFRLGYLTLATPHVKAVVPAFGGIVGARSEQDVALVLHHLTEPMRSGEADLLVARQVEVGSDLARALAGSFPRYLFRHGIRPSARWTAAVPGSLEDFLAGRSSKSRSRLRSQDRQLEKEMGGDLVVRRLHDPHDLERLLTDVEAVASRSYQRAIGAGHHNTALDRALIETEVRHGWYRCWLLYLRGVPVAYWSGTVYDGTFAVSTTAYDRAHAASSVGRYLMMRMFEDLCADGQVHRLDFGQGEADYKRAFARHERDEVDVWLASARVGPTCLNGAASLLEAANSVARGAVSASPALSRLKRRWRHARTSATEG